MEYGNGPEKADVTELKHGAGVGGKNVNQVWNSNNTGSSSDRELRSWFRMDGRTRSYVREREWHEPRDGHDGRFPEDEFPRTIPEDDSRGQSLMSEETVIYRVTSAVDDAWRARMVRTAKRLANCR